jgi:sec-independent protein translocase protein TatB
VALIVLGPEKLPRVVAEIGRWVGRARAMARQFREQLEEEVQLEEARKAQRAAPAPQPDPEPASAAAPPGPAGNGSATQVTPETPHAHPGGAPAADPTAALPAHAGGADERRT